MFTRGFMVLYLAWLATVVVGMVVGFGNSSFNLIAMAVATSLGIVIDVSAFLGEGMDSSSKNIAAFFLAAVSILFMAWYCADQMVGAQILVGICQVALVLVGLFSPILVGIPWVLSVVTKDKVQSVRG